MIAVNVALLPPDEIMDIVIDINHKFEPVTIPLNKTDNLPHISLAMGVIKEEDIPKVNDVLKQVVDKFNVLELEITEIFVPKPHETKTIAFTIKNTDEIQRLHNEVMKSMRPFFDYSEVTDEMFYGKKVNEVTKSWVKNYERKYSGESSFRPHISFKCKKPVNFVFDFPIKFKASKFGLFHFGDDGTIRNNLGLFELK